MRRQTNAGYFPPSALIALERSEAVVADRVTWASGVFCFFIVRVHCVDDEESLYTRRYRIHHGLDMSRLR